MLVSEEGNQAEEEPNDSIVNIAGLWQQSLASGSKSSMLVSEEDNQAEEKPNDRIVNIAGLWRHKV